MGVLIRPYLDAEKGKIMFEEKIIALKNAILRGDKEIKEIKVRKPNVAALKGLKLLDVFQSDVNTWITLLPRITTPTLTKADINNMDVADLTQLIGDAVTLMNGAEDEDIEEGKND